MTKVLFVGSDPCEFCTMMMTFSDHWSDDSELVKGRVYTQISSFKNTYRGLTGVGIRLAEVCLPEGWGHCSCQFREIDGDPDAWREILRENKHNPKKVLELL